MIPKQPLQARVLALVKEQGPFPFNTILRALGNVERVALDCCLGALVRDRKLVSDLGRYDIPKSPLTPRDERGESASPRIRVTAPVPNAKQDPRVCVTCHVPQPDCEFRPIGSGDERARECNTCHGKKIRAGRVKAAARKASTVVQEARVILAPIADTTTPEIAAHDQPESAERSVTANPVFERVVAARQKALNDIAVLEVDLANRRAAVGECDQFLELHTKFAEGRA